MGYSGRIQTLCESGHYEVAPDDTFDSRAVPLSKRVCLVCARPIVWVNMVDDTNCDSHGFVEMKVLLPRIVSTTFSGGRHVTTVQHAVYEHPKKGGWDPRGG